MLLRCVSTHSFPVLVVTVRSVETLVTCLGGIAAVSDIAYHTKIRDRRAQLIRFAYFTVPMAAGTTGFVGGLEITKKYTNNRYAAYAAACAVPAGVYATFWRQWTRDVFSSYNYLDFTLSLPT